MGGLALSVQPRNAILRIGEHGINLCLLGRGCKKKKKKKTQDASKGHLIHIAVSLSLPLFLIHTDPWRLILGDSYTRPSHTPSLSPPHTHTPPSEPLSVHLHSRPVDKPRITMWSRLLKAHGQLFFFLHHYLPVQDFASSSRYRCPVEINQKQLMWVELCYLWDSVGIQTSSNK